jgi:hypothetical protein
MKAWKSAATTNFCLKTSMLQWGHADEGVEKIRLRSGLAPRSCIFNEATLKAWRLSELLGLYREPVWCAMGVCFFQPVGARLCREQS